jgi:hypothetical protein
LQAAGVRTPTDVSEPQALDAGKLNRMVD